MRDDANSVYSLNQKIWQTAIATCLVKWVDIACWKWFWQCWNWRPDLRILISSWSNWIHACVPSKSFLLFTTAVAVSRQVWSTVFSLQCRYSATCVYSDKRTKIKIMTKWSTVFVELICVLRSTIHRPERTRETCRLQMQKGSDLTWGSILVINESCSKFGVHCREELWTIMGFDLWFRFDHKWRWKWLLLPVFFFFFCWKLKFEQWKKKKHVVILFQQESLQTTKFSKNMRTSFDFINSISQTAVKLTIAHSGTFSRHLHRCANQFVKETFFLFRKHKAAQGPVEESIWAWALFCLW